MKLIKRLQTEGWRVELIYLALPDLEMSKARVKERVKHSGHNIPNKDIERRFSRSLKNLLNDFSILVDSCRCFMNINNSPELVFEQEGEKRSIINQDYYQHLLLEARK